MYANSKRSEGGTSPKDGPFRRPSAVTWAEVKQTDQRIRYNRKIGIGEISSEMNISSVKKGVRVAYGSVEHTLFLCVYKLHVDLTWAACVTATRTGRLVIGLRSRASSSNFIS
jgi:hypothetical protein